MSVFSPQDQQPRAPMTRSSDSVWCLYLLLRSTSFTQSGLYVYKVLVTMQSFAVFGMLVVCLHYARLLWSLIPKANQHINEPKYICGQNWVKLLSFSLFCEIWCIQGFWVTACCDLDVWSFDLIGMSQALIQTSPNFCEICSNICEDIVFTRFWGHYLLWPWPLIQKANQHYEPNTSVN